MCTNRVCRTGIGPLFFESTYGRATGHGPVTRSKSLRDSSGRAFDRKQAAADNQAVCNQWLPAKPSLGEPALRTGVPGDAEVVSVRLWSRNGYVGMGLSNNFSRKDPSHGEARRLCRHQ